MSTPAPPLLASTLWTTEKRQISQSPPPPPLLLLPTGLPSLPTDRILLHYGHIHLFTTSRPLPLSISHRHPHHHPHHHILPPASPTTTLALHVLIAHLLAAPHFIATVIDTPGAGEAAMDVRLMERAVARRILAAEGRGMEDEGEGREKVSRILERVRIMRVFDTEGLMEAVEEVMKGEAENEGEGQEDSHYHRLLLIPALSHLLTPLLQSHYLHAQTLLSSLLRSLRHLTRERNFCTLLFGAASAKPVRAEREGEEGLQLLRRLSRFDAAQFQPVLGYGVGRLVDVHLYVHEVGRRGRGSRGEREIDADAGAVEGEGEESGKVLRRNTEESVMVLEIVQDRFGERTGQWAPFVCGEDGALEDAL